jgi:ubiquinone/menaquinone biosynthesis C-methylase UbiE
MHRYNATANMYDGRYCQEQLAKYKAAKENLKLDGQGAALDVGCGSGMFFEHAAGSVEALVGVDVSKELLLQARDRAKRLGNVFVVLADADHLPFKAGHFRYVFAFTVLQNMPKPVQTLAEFKQAAGVGGVFVLTALKRAIPLETFGEWLERATLDVVSLNDKDELQCYVVAAVSRQTEKAVSATHF